MSEAYTLLFGKYGVKDHIQVSPWRALLSFLVICPKPDSGKGLSAVVSPGAAVRD